MIALLLLLQDPAPPSPVPAQDAARAARVAARERARAEDRAQRVLVTVFQEDRHADLGRDELLRRMLTFDRDEDARVSLEEFRRIAAWSPARAPRGGDAPPSVEDAWSALLPVADADADGTLAHAEALTFFDARDLDRDGVLTRNERVDGPRVGERAPDFALASPASADLQSLSGLIARGQPVALLFGSWS